MFIICILCRFIISLLLSYFDEIKLVIEFFCSVFLLLFFIHFVISVTVMFISPKRITVASIVKCLD